MRRNIAAVQNSDFSALNVDRQTARWIRPYTFEQVVYQEDETLENKLSDHCPIAVMIETQ